MAMHPLRQQYLTKAKRVVLKLGSAVLTAPDGLNLPLIQRLVGEIGRLISGEREFILVSSGAIAAGCRKLGLTSRPTGIPQAQAVAAAGQSALILTYEEAFAEFGLKVAQILLTHDDLESRHRFLNARNTLFTLLQWQVVPIINENDTVATDELKFGDNDNLAALICNLVGADLLILLTDIEGLFDRDPREYPDARLLKLVETINAGVEKAAGKKAGALGRGGMLSKVQAAKKAGAAGLPTLIANGLTPGILGRIFAAEEVGTLFLPQAQKLTSRQYWLAYNVTPKGAILVDYGAREALIQRHKSLLPAGILEVFGGFGKGAAVHLMDPDGKPFAVGLTNYTAREIGRIKGRQSQEIAQALGGPQDYDEVIHRDNLVIFPEV
ncbi:MAG: glutamate 5-kinase [Syntrophobacterales bacterium]|jgi:glutamate 5-kinase|nr:glutamate 5-kinase [Syntrophobacterales bacterium]